MADVDAETAFLTSLRGEEEVTGDQGAREGSGDTDQSRSFATEDRNHVQDPKLSSLSTHADDPGHPFTPALAVAADTPSPSETLQPASDPATPAAAPDTTARSVSHVADPTAPLNVEPTTADGEAAARPSVNGTEGQRADDTSTGLDPPLSTSSASVAGLASQVPAPAASSETTLQDVSMPKVTSPTGADTLAPGTVDPPSHPGLFPSSHETMSSHEAPAPAITPAAASANVTSTSAASSGAGTPTRAVASKARLPHDKVGILEDRIKDDPRGDLDAWLSLIDEHRKRNKLDDARATYERFFKLFPSAADQWMAYASMELAQNDFYRLEQIFNKVLLTIPNVSLWSLYLDYVRRRNNLTTDTAGTARTTVSQAYDFVLQNVGIDKDSGRIWHDYVQFIRSGPGLIGGSSWQDQQKMDLLRKTYQRAICVPTSAVNALWKEYDAFEMGLNKITGRKFLQEKSPAYMTARSSNIELDNLTRGLHRTTLPRLPPALGFDGDEEYLAQVEIWKKWIRWEKDDPLVLKEEDPAAYKARVIYVYKQAVMALRFWPEMWFEASDFCFSHGLDQEGTDFLTQGMAANPESCLLAFKRADRLEQSLTADEGPEGLKRRGAAVREPYDKLLDALYELIAKAKAREALDVARINALDPPGRPSSPGAAVSRHEDDEDELDSRKQEWEAAKQAQIKIVQDGVAVHVRLLSRTVSFAWIALMRAMRRIQGKGKVGDALGGSRQIFTDARKRGRLTSDVYVASAMIEYHCYKDPAATKIFERGMRLFPEDDAFALEYLKHLIAVNDVTNARAVFEMTVSKLAQRPETLRKAKPIYAFFHEYEAQYGELSQVSKLEKRMSDLFPEDPTLTQFAHRFTAQGFDPTAVRPIISAAAQTRPKAFPSVEPTTSVPNSPAPRYAHGVHSPKRAAPADESDNDPGRPRKLARGESPLKGAAGRRLDQQKRHQHVGPGQGSGPHAGAHPQGSWPPSYPAAPTLPRELLFLLSIIPKAETYPPTARFNPERIVRLLRDTNLPSHVPAQFRSSSVGMGHNQHNGSYAYAR